MKEYTLSKSQWEQLWLPIQSHWEVTINIININTIDKEYHNRVDIFLNKFPDLYYREALHDYNNPEYYGIITYHEDKDLTFFLLQL